MFLLGFSSVPRWGLACPWVSGSAAHFALGLKNFSTPLNFDNRAYSIQCLSAKRGWNTFMENRTGQSNFGEFSCFKLGSRNECDGNAWGTYLSAAVRTDNSRRPAFTGGPCAPFHDASKNAGFRTHDLT